VCAGLYVLQIVGLSEKSQVSIFQKKRFLWIRSWNFYFKIMQANIQLVFLWVF
jgi:hypothetical protein